MGMICSAIECIQLCQKKKNLDVSICWPRLMREYWGFAKFYDFGYPTVTSKYIFSSCPFSIGDKGKVLGRPCEPCSEKKGLMYSQKKKIVSGQAA